MAHGTSAAMAFRVRRETDFACIRAMLDLSLSTMIIMAVSFLIMGLTGLILPFLIHIWNKGYIGLNCSHVVCLCLYGYIQ